MNLTLPFLETMITQACNLSCLGCTNYSDLKHNGYVSWNEGRQWISNWNKKLSILDFGIIGGEPLINPEVREWLSGVRLLLPNAQIRFTTNGLLLDKHPDLLDFLHNLGNIVFKITVHVNESKLEKSIKDILSAKSWQAVNEHGINRWRTTNGLRFQVNRPTWFVKTYKHDYASMMPHDSPPDRAFNQCVQQTCPLLYKGRIYKCSTAGLLKDLLKRFDNPNFNQWSDYIDSGIGIEDDDLAIKSFLDNFGKHHSICGQCPDHGAPRIDHIKFVTRK